ncbi:MAG: hypothetical protein SNJ71_01720 [Bacteroidales bacterium]
MKDVITYANKKEIKVELAFMDSIVSHNEDIQRFCPVAYSLSLRTVLFPLYPRLTGKQVEAVAKVLATLP